MMEPTIMKPLMVTGLSGMVGTRFKALFEDKYAFENLDLTNGVDITNAASVEAVIQKSEASILIHLAAFTNVTAAYEQQDDENGSCYKVNVTGTKNIAEACDKYHKYLIHVSTDFVFDGTKDEPYIETDIPHPIEWYGETKFKAEQIIQQIMSHFVILRMAYPYQAKPIRPDFLNNLRTKLMAETLPPQFTDHTITPTFVDDVAKIFDYCVSFRPTGIYHMVGSSSHTDFELANLVKAEWQLESPIKPGLLVEYLKTVKRPYQQTMKVSNQKLIHDFGIKMMSFPEGIRSIHESVS
jgi:dTDP-4-dehydrorhamnose reductase